MTVPEKAGDERPPGAPVRRIVLCHLESLCGLPALNHLFDTFGDRIGLVLSSRRFGPKHGGALRQFLAGVRRSGLRLTLWLGFDIVGAQLLSRATRVRSLLGRQAAQLVTLRDLARRHGARLLEVDDVNAAATLDTVRAYDPDLMIVMNLDQILQAPLIALPRVGVLNVHPSLLPSLRGPCPAYWALAEGREVSGVSIHLIEDERIDAGRVLVRHESLISRSQSVAEITTRLFLAGARALPQAVSALENQDLPDATAVPSEGEYRGFPDRRSMAASARSGVRLFGLGHILRILYASIMGHGWRRQNDES